MPGTSPGTGEGDHQQAYSVFGALQRYTPPAAGITTPQTLFTPGPDQFEVAGMSLPDGRNVDLQYSVGRLETAQIALGTITRSFDPATGQLSELSMPQRSGTAQQLQFGYDGDIPLRETWTGPVNGTVEAQLNPADDLRLQEIVITSEALGSSKASRVIPTFSEDGLLEHVVVQGATPTNRRGLTLTRDAALGHIQSILVAGSPVRTEISGLTRYGEIDQVTHSWPRGSLKFDFDYDALGRISRRTENDTAWDYHYDARGRLVDVFEQGQTEPTYHYEYDANSNRIAWTDFSGSCDTPNCTNYDDQDRLLQYGDVTYAYNDFGQLIARIEADTETTHYEYDELGNLRHVTLPNGDEIDYIIDGRGRRVARNVNGVRDRGWLYGDALNPLAELDDHGDLTKVFVYASQPHVPDLVVTPTDTYRVITDQVGSVRYVLNTRRGIVAQRFEYDPFGNIIDAEGDPTLQPFRFAGGLYDDATGLLRFGARDYDPEVGRWTAKDPALFGGGQTNLYGYAFNDPINYADISGEVPIPLIVFAIGLALVLPSDSGSDPNGDPTGFFAVCAGPAIDAAVGFAIGRLFGSSAGGAAASGGGAKALRSQYVQTADELGQLAQRLRGRGMSAEEVVRTVSPMRNELKLNIRAQGSWLAARAADARNLLRYGNRAGPSADDLFRRYASWDAALQAISRTHPTLNHILGVGQ